MKLSRLRNKSLRKKIKTQSSAENIFISALMKNIQKQINKYNLKDNDFNEFERILQNLNFTKLPKMSKMLGRKILKRNREGFSGILEALSEGLTQIKNQNREEKLFKKAMNSLAKEEKYFAPIMEKFTQNVNKIKEIPFELINILRNAYLKGEGLRGTEFEKLIYEKMKKRAKLIVRTESSKINSAFTEVRAKALNLKGYIWSSSADKRVRDSHSAMDGVLVFWNNPPTFRSISKKGKINDMVGGAGETPNCRCVMLPVFELDDIQFPVKVAENAVLTEKYEGKGKYNLSIRGINKYTKDEFLKKFNYIIR